MADVIAMVADGICHMYIWADVFALYVTYGTAKSLCSEIKMYSVIEKSIALLNIQTEWETYTLL